MKRFAFFSVACASVMLLATASQADDAKCRDQVYNTARKVLAQEAGGNRKDCVKDKTGNQDTCVDNERPKAAEKRAQLVAKHADKCSPLPGFGVIADPNDIADAAEAAADNAIRFIFGDPVNLGMTATKCNDKLAQRAGQLAVAQWKAVRACAKGQTTSGAVESCIASGIAAGTTAKGSKVTEARALGDCDAGYPSAADIIDQVECEVCLAWQASTGLDPDCDAISGTSCEVPVHKCTFAEGPGNSSDLDIILTGNLSIGGLVGDVSGAVDLSCPPATQDVNGKRVCTCSLQAWTPVNITGIGFICIDGAGSCPSGEMDCDGGNALGVDSWDDHQIGSCTSHADCSNQCDTYCNGLGMVQLRSGCENFCQGGPRDGLACICDQPGPGCGTPGQDDCPGGSCVGKNNETDTDCQCYCANLGFGGPSAPGTFQCLLPTDIKVVAALPCTNAALVDLPPICAPITSGSARGETDNVNESPTEFIGPHTLVGTSDTCANFDSSVMSGYKAVTNIGFFDSTVGDLRAHLTVDCQ